MLLGWQTSGCEVCVADWLLPGSYWYFSDEEKKSQLLKNCSDLVLLKIFEILFLHSNGQTSD